jgi:hypothetical protein
MAKILLTGMTALHCSLTANVKNLSFSGVLHDALVSNGHTVTWRDPDIFETEESLNSYDSVIVGLAPVTSLGANRAYAALALVDTLWESNKLTLLIDAPQPSQILVSLKSVTSGTGDLFKEFFSYRKNYRAVVTDDTLKSRVISGVDRLLNSTWGTTIYPSLPWKLSDGASMQLPDGAADSVFGVNLDSFLLSESKVQEVNLDKRDKWVVDSFAHRHTRKLTESLVHPTSLMKWNKGWDDTQVLDQIDRSMAAIVATNKGDGTWWSYRYIQALDTTTPIYSDWKETGWLSPAWNQLPSTIEHMSYGDRCDLAREQRSSYINAIPNKKEAITILEEILNLGDN